MLLAYEAMISQNLQRLLSRLDRLAQEARAISSIRDAQRPNESTSRHLLRVAAD